MNANVEIKRADKKNLHTLTVLTKTFFPYVNFSSDEINRRLTSNEIAYFVALHDGATVGFVDYEIIRSSPEQPRCRCKLIGLAVLPEFRQKGIARKLIERVLQETQLEKCNSIFLLVAEDNAIAIKLYTSLGFSSRGSADKVLGGKKILIMEKFLGSNSI
ncbi:MAG: GNAT family N-acetyltransferase [Candidatus Micrarchaeota archaeon]